MVMIVMILVVATLTIGVGIFLWKNIMPGYTGASWPEAASRMGLTHRPYEVKTAIHPGTIEGVYRDHPVLIEMLHRLNQTDGMKVSVYFSTELGVGLVLSSASYLAEDATDNTASYQVLLTGDADFDKRYSPKAIDAAGGNRLLAGQTTRQRIESLNQSGIELLIVDEKIEYRSDRMESDPARLESLVNDLIDLANALEAEVR